MTRFITLLSLSVLLLGGCTKSERHIFLFIGDGMGENHVLLADTEANFVQFPVKGYVITNSLSDGATDSAAAGTALATGNKTKNGTIGMDSTHTTEYKTIMDVAKSNGWGTGVATSVSIDHATPAGFYAHNASRENYYEISGDVIEGGLDLYAGSGFRDPGDNFRKFEQAGYTIFRGKDADLEADKVVWIQQSGQKVENIPYVFDSVENQMELSDMTEEVIEFFEERGGSFFVMVEGGLIDWASHDNDLPRARGEVNGFVDAVQEAMEFYKENPDNTLIIVTADHETGGLSFDKSGNGTWSTDGHTTVNVPIYAIGAGAEEFSGTMDNTEITKKITKLIEQK